MPDLLTILNQSSTSLAAHREAAAVAGQNIANVNTPGYSRQTVNLEALTPDQLVPNGWIGRGVDVQSISQSRDAFLERQIPNAIASQSSSSTESDALAAVSALDPNAPGGVSSALSAFYSSLRAVAQNPADPRRAVRRSRRRRSLAQSFNRTSQAIEDARSGLDDKINGIVNEVNTDAANMASLNAQIRTARAGGAEPNDLLDARRQLQDKLTELTGAQPVMDSQGDVSMALPGGTALVSQDRAAQLSTIPDSSNRGHLSLRITRADGSGPVRYRPARRGGDRRRDRGARRNARRGLDVARLAGVRFCQRDQRRLVRRASRRTARPGTTCSASARRRRARRRRSRSIRRWRANPSLLAGGVVGRGPARRQHQHERDDRHRADRSGRRLGS